MTRWAAGIAAALAATGAQAGVVYNWTTTDAGNLGAFAARLEVADSAYLAGNLAESYQAQCPTQDPLCTDSGSTRLIGFELTPAPGSNAAGLSLAFAEPNAGIRLAPVAIMGWALDFLADGGLAGRFYATDNAAAYRFSGDGAWGLDFFGVDTGLFGCETPSGPQPSLPSCTTTGRWQLDASTAPADGQVPEPGILPLMAIASLGLGASLRRRQASRA